MKNHIGYSTLPYACSNFSNFVGYGAVSSSPPFLLMMNMFQFDTIEFYI